jgi:predicted GIY-YIG superfamily endonuclease
MDKVKPPLIDLEGRTMPTGRKLEKSLQRERLSEGDQMYCVYWIRREDYTDPSATGYIGITSNLTSRLKSHKKNRRKTPFTMAIKKYGWETLIVDILHENLTIQEALSIENTLRPEQRIGWNCQRGGELGVESSWYDIEDNRSKHRESTSIATKKGIAIKDTKEARAQRARGNWKNKPESYRDVSLGSNNPRAILTEEQVKYIKVQLSGGETTQKLADLFNVRIHVIQQIKSGKNWSHV